VSEDQTETVVKPLYSDAGSGILFNLGSDISIGDQSLPVGVIMLPVKKRADLIRLPPGALLAGIRFHPAVGYGVLGRHYEKNSLLSSAEDQHFRLYPLFETLTAQTTHDEVIARLYQWAEDNIGLTDLVPAALEDLLGCLDQDGKTSQLTEHIELSQRQIERLFKTWLDMTPKHYQRVLRIKKTILFLREHKGTDLADVAIHFGFSDQSHMTREFRSIAGITPGQV